MNKNWFWPIISFTSLLLLIVFSIRLVVYNNPDVPLFTEFISLYENTDFDLFDFYNDIVEYIKDFLLLKKTGLVETIPLLDLGDTFGFDDLIPILVNIFYSITNLGITLINAIYTVFATLALSVLNSVNMAFEVFRILLVLLQFTLGIQIG